MRAAVQFLMASGATSIGCSMIVSECVDIEVERKLTSAIRYPWYTIASKQRKILPARGNWISLGCRGICLSLSSTIEPTRQRDVVEAVSLDRVYRHLANRRV